MSNDKKLCLQGEKGCIIIMTAGPDQGSVRKNDSKLGEGIIMGVFSKYHRFREAGEAVNVNNAAEYGQPARSLFYHVKGVLAA